MGVYDDCDKCNGGHENLFDDCDSCNRHMTVCDHCGYCQRCGCYAD